MLGKVERLQSLMVRRFFRLEIQTTFLNISDLFLRRNSIADEVWERELILVRWYFNFGVARPMRRKLLKVTLGAQYRCLDRAWLGLSCPTTSSVQFFAF